MDNKTYHHKNLKVELIESGIILLNKEGYNNFSLRKVAILCGVSHNAPYSHFKNKEVLLDEMKHYVVERFSQMLKAIIKKNYESKKLMTYLAKGYVLFFKDNPEYFYFIFYGTSLYLNLSYKENIIASDFEPFLIFKEQAERVMESMNIPKSDYINNIIAMWTIVHGFTSMVIMKGFTFDGEIENLIETILVEKINLAQK